MFARGGPPPRNPPPSGFNQPPNWGGPMGPPGTIGGQSGLMGPGPNGPPFAPPGLLGGPPHMVNGPGTGGNSNNQFSATGPSVGVSRLKKRVKM